MVLSTHTQPGGLAEGYHFASSAYRLSPSGALTETLRIMTISLRHTPNLPGAADPHTLSVIRWKDNPPAWELLDGDLDLGDETITFITKRFGIYALATTPVWRDTFTDSALGGVSASSNIKHLQSGSIVLSAGATSGSVTSIPIVAPPGAKSWSTLSFSVTEALNTDLIVDVLGANGQILIENVSDSTDLACLSLSAHPQIKLRATLTAAAPGTTPELHEWRLAWIPGEHRIYLPLVTSGQQ
jgi:hypothetical protein